MCFCFEIYTKIIFSLSNLSFIVYQTVSKFSYFHNRSNSSHIMINIQPITRSDSYVKLARQHMTNDHQVYLVSLSYLDVSLLWLVRLLYCLQLMLHCTLSLLDVRSKGPFSEPQGNLPYEITNFAFRIFILLIPARHLRISSLLLILFLNFSFLY